MTKQVIRIRRRRDPQLLRHRAEISVIEKIERSSRPLPPRSFEPYVCSADGVLKAPLLKEKLQNAIEQRRQQQNAAIKKRLAELNQVSESFLKLLELVASELHGKVWELTVSSKVEKRPNPSKKIFQGKLIRRNENGQPFAYRDEIENRLNKEMLELIDGYWFYWNGKQAIDTELVRKIVTRRTWSLIENLQ